MGRSLAWLVMAIALWSASVTVARAATGIDHRCLSACTAQGGGAASCLDTCRYVPAGPPAGPPAGRVQARSSPHDPFDTPLPVNGVIVPGGGPAAPSAATPSPMLAPTRQPLGPSTNYGCLTRCVQGGLLHEYCRQRCSY